MLFFNLNLRLFLARKHICKKDASGGLTNKTPLSNRLKKEKVPPCPQAAGRLGDFWQAGLANRARISFPEAP
jgi:hypothetical protein